MLTEQLEVILLSHLKRFGGGAADLYLLGTKVAKLHNILRKRFACRGAVHPARGLHQLSRIFNHGRLLLKKRRQQGAERRLVDGCA